MRHPLSWIHIHVWSFYIEFIGLNLLIFFDNFPTKDHHVWSNEIFRDMMGSCPRIESW